MKCFLMTAALMITGAGVLTAQTASDPETATPTQVPTKTDTLTVESWGLTLTEVPELVRLHLPMLRRKVGLVVRSVIADSPADQLGLIAGDILIEIDQAAVRTAADLGQPNLRFGLMIIRRGMPEMLPATGNPTTRILANRAFSPFGVSPSFGGSASSSVSSSSSSSGESVSISKSGDEISLDIASSDPAVGRVQLSGTMADIQSQLRGGDLSDDAKAAVRRALQGSR